MTEINWLHDRLNVGCDALISEHTRSHQRKNSGGIIFFEQELRRQLRTAVILQVNNVAMLAPARIAFDGPRRAGRFKACATGMTDGQRLVLAVRGVSPSKQALDGC
jgi:hypothetical protein